ncbi:type I-E CRISPR-associated protein Cas6/Cse3/CasE [Streptomyces harbinensis]|uniref:type I-E CRISPR-associated protein Cas6/Cse3/CasE n=1 Tax=Streptomyces harbinensis TaxID=1176198 RepID=UPI001591BD47|nr:type I-E CRISPR-associated protein Cas6/Cse3/CasE [Streptomyces harbinensis]QKV71350.1 type I-E CRISPR-associated protein Cas6/Cse3/CasE [Streptomyces harbinensis]
MTYLSRIRINPLRAASRALLANPHAMHGAVAGGIPGAPDSERVLWRLDADNPHRPHLFVLTRSKPDWTHIVESAGWPEADGEHVAVRDYTPLLDRVALGREFAFRLTANPVQNTLKPLRPTPGQQARLNAAGSSAEARRPRGLRLGHRTASAQLRWFLERTERWGFTVPPARFVPSVSEDEADLSGGEDVPRDLRITERRRHSFAKGEARGNPGNPRKPHVTLSTATFEGRLRVTDPATFTDRLLNGIGPAKAYGCGLLTLAPVPEGNH